MGVLSWHATLPLSQGTVLVMVKATPMLGRDMAVDLGTLATRVFPRDADVPFVLPTNGGETWNTPMRGGVIADFDACVALLTEAVRRVHERRYLARPRMLLAVPALTTAVERRAAREAGYQAGARQVTLVDAPLMAAIGSGLPVHRRTGTMIVTLGAGLTEVTALSLGTVVASTSARVSGGDLDRAVAGWVRTQHGAVITAETAEDLKLEMGSAWPLHDGATLEIGARTPDGDLRTFGVSGGDLRHAMSEPLGDIIEAISRMLDALPGLREDVLDHGIVLAGAGAQLPGLDLLLSHELQLPALVAPSPTYAVVAGAHRVLSDAALLRSIQMAGERSVG